MNTPSTEAAAPLDPGEQFRLLAENVTDYAVFLADVNGTKVSWNAGVERITGYTEAEFVGQPAGLLFTPEDRERGAHLQGMQTAAAQGRAADERWHIKKNGTRFWGSGIMTGLRDEHGTLRGFCKIVRDETDRYQRERRAATQYAVSRALAEATGVDDMAARVLEAIGREMGWALGTFWQVEAHEQVLRPRALWHAADLVDTTAPFEADTCAMTFAPGQGLPGGVWATGQTLWAPDVFVMPNFPRRHAAAEAGLRTAVVFPVRNGSEILGVIEFFSPDLREPDDSERRTLAVIGSQVGQFLARVQAEEALRARAEREALLNRIGQAIRSSADPEVIQGAAVAALGEALRVDRCYFAQYNPAANRVLVGRDWHRPDLPSLAGEYDQAAMDLDVKVLYPDQAPLVVEDVRAAAGRISPKAAAILEAFGLRATISVGLFGDGGLLRAALTVATADAPRSWTPDEVALVEAVAAQTRTAVEEARVRERERNIAEQLQAVLRPTLPGEVPGLDLEPHYRAALDEASVGGDLYAVFPIEKDRTTLVVADVSGKGLAAASQVATLRDMLRFALHQRHTLAESVTDLNRILAQNHLLAGFATLFVGTYDSGARTLTYVSCGQEPGLVWRAATGTVEELPPTGAVLGAFEEAAFEEASVPLAPGDVLAVFTDGLTEIGPDRSRLLGIQGVAALLKEHTPAHGSAADIVSDLVAAAEAYGRGGVRDDIALLVGVVGGGRSGAEDKVYGR